MEPKSGKQPKLASSDQVSLALGSKPKRRASDRLVTAIVPVKGEGIGKGVLKLLRALLALLLALVFTLVLSWFVLISTISATPKLGNDYLLVDRNAWGLGSAEPGSIAFSTTANQYGLIEKIVYHFDGSMDDGSAVEIIAGPLDLVSTNLDGVLVVNGEASSYPSDKIIDRKQLGDTYIALCLEGSCGLPGTLVEIPIQNAIGEIAGTIKVSGLQPYDN
jgi:hypothetical protein